MKLATERELEDASLAEEVTVVEGRTFALSSKRGNRRFSCEDAYQAAPGLDGDPTRGIFSVFDGHGGGRQRTMPQIICTTTSSGRSMTSGHTWTLTSL